MSNKLYLITTNNKKFEEWSKQNKKRLKGLALEHFNAGYNDVANGNYLARASFVCYWEIYNNNSLAKVAPAMTQASLIHMMHRFMERQQQDEVIEQSHKQELIEKAQQLEQARKRSEEERKRSEAAEKLKKQIAEATPEELAALWRAGKLDARDYNRANPRKTIQKGPSQSEPGFYVGPRGGRYRINSSGRKSYDVP